MTTRVSDLYEKARSLGEQVEENFLDLANVLRQLADRDPRMFAKAIEEAKLGRRKAYYLVGIDRNFEHIAIPKSRLREIGWTKLGIIGRYVDNQNAVELLNLAERHTVKELERLMRGHEAGENTRCVLMYFTPNQYAQLENALIEHGATRSGRGLLNKEEALLRALKADAKA